MHVWLGASPRISIVIATLNAAQFVGRCLESIVAQDYSNYEIVVVDGASADGTLDILRHYAAVFGGQLTWVSEPDSGIAEAWNKGVRLTRGEWLIFIGADDALSAPDVFSRIAAPLAKAFPSHSIVYGTVDATGQDGSLIEHCDWPWSPLRFRNCIENLPHAAVFHHRSLFSCHGCFDPAFKVTLDYDFLLRALMNSTPLQVSDLVVTDAQIGGVSTDFRNYPLAIRERIKLSRRHIGRVPFLVRWWIAKVWASWVLYKIGDRWLVSWGRTIYRALTLRRVTTPTASRFAIRKVQPNTR